MLKPRDRFRIKMISGFVQQKDISLLMQQTREVFAVVSAQLDTLLARWRKAQERLVPALNRMAAKAKLPVIG